MEFIKKNARFVQVGQTLYGADKLTELKEKHPKKFDQLVKLNIITLTKTKQDKKETKDEQTK